MGRAKNVPSLSYRPTTCMRTRSLKSDLRLSARRSFLKQSAITSGFLGLGRYLKADRRGEHQKRVISPYGPLVPDKDKLLDLPAGFTYRVISKRGGTMSDGLRVPGMFDDMAAFPGEGGRIIIVRNHELALNQSHLGAFPRNRLPASVDRDLVYDPGEGDEPPQPGGTTTIVYNPATGETEKEFLSLAGSHRNCSGGAMPWGGPKFGSMCAASATAGLFTAIWARLVAASPSKARPSLRTMKYYYGAACRVQF